MSWFKKYLTAGHGMTVEEALKVLNIPYGDGSFDDIKGKAADQAQQIVRRHRNRLALEIHPDKARYPAQKMEFERRMKEVNNAFDTLKSIGFNIGSGRKPSGFGSGFGNMWDDFVDII